MNQGAKQLIKDIFVFSMGTVMTKLIQFLLMPLYTSSLTTEAYGAAELVNNLAEFFYPILTLSAFEAVLRFLVGKEYGEKTIATSGLKLMILSAGGGIVLFSIIDLIGNYPYTTQLFWITYTYALKTMLSFFVRGKGYSKLFASSGIINAICLAGFSVLFLVIADFGTNGYLYAIGLSYLCTSVYLIAAGKIYRDIDLRIRCRPALVEMLRFSAPLILYNIGYWLINMSGRYVLLLFTSYSVVGMYIAVMKISSVINMFQQALYAALQLNNSRMFNHKEREKYYSDIFNSYAVIALTAGGWILCFSPILVKFTLKNEFYAGHIYIPVVLLTALMECIFSFYKTLYTACKKTRRALPSMVIGTLVNLLLCMMFVPMFEIWGVVLASLISTLFQIIYRIWDVRHFVRMKVCWVRLIPGFVGIGVQTILLTTSWNQTILPAVIAICLTVYFFFAYFRGLLQSLIKSGALHVRSGKQNIKING